MPKNLHHPFPRPSFCCIWLAACCQRYFHSLQLHHQKPPQCRNYGIVSRQSTSLSIKKKEPANNSYKKKDKQNAEYTCSEFDCIFDSEQVKSKYKHADSFGIDGNYNPVNGLLFQEALIDHMREFKAIAGTYHGTPVDHYLNPNTRLNVMVNRQTGRFWSAWELSETQLEHVLEHGNLGGG